MNDDWTTIENVLSELPRTNSDAARSERVRGRCHKQLTRPRRLPRRSRDCKARVAKAGPLESAVVGGFCAVYFVGVALMALHTHGIL